MRRIVLALLPLLAAPALAAESRTIAESFTLTPEQDVRVDFPVGALRFEAAPGDTVAVEIELTCKHGGSRCVDAMEEVRLDSHAGASRLSLGIDRHPKWHWDNIKIEGLVRLPTDRDLAVDMGVGELEIAGLAGDLTIDVGVGEVNIDVPAAAVGSVRLDVGVGDASLRAPDGWIEGQRSLLVGSEVHWDGGPGKARLWVDLGVGEISVDLEEP